MGVELPFGVSQTPGCVAWGRGGWLHRAFRRCACGLPAATDVGPPWGPHVYMVPFRGFAHGSPAVIESSPPMGAQASRCTLGRGGPSAAWEFACVETRFIASLTDGPAAGKNAMAGLCPERVRRDESRLYVADFPYRRRDSREAGLCVTSGGAQRNPRWGDE